MKGTMPPSLPKLVGEADITSLICWKGRHCKQKDLPFKLIADGMLFSWCNFGICHSY